MTGAPTPNLYQVWLNVN